jgi:hypothetical protein
MWCERFTTQVTFTGCSSTIVPAPCVLAVGEAAQGEGRRERKPRRGEDPTEGEEPKQLRGQELERGIKKKLRKLPRN